MADPAATIRGAALRPFVTWYAREHGRAGLDRALARVAPSEQRRFDPRDAGLGISASAWYPAPVVHGMLDGLLEGLDERGRSALAQRGAESTLDETLDGYLRMFFRAFVSPRVCAFLGPQLWRAFYSGGQVSVVSQTSRSHVMTVSGWDGHHDFLCQMNNAAGRSIYRAAGCRFVSTEQATCVGRGDRICTYVITW